MLAAFAHGIDAQNPLSVLTVGEIEPPPVPHEWVNVTVRAASLNHHDVWALRGQALTADRVPMILGTDAVGVTDDGREVLVYAVIADPRFADETIDPGRSILSEVYPGTLAERVRVPARNLVEKPAHLSWEEAACLPTAFLTAYRMLTTRGDVQEGQTVLVQGAGGGVATAAIILAQALGARVWVTSRDPEKREWARSIGADQTFDVGARLPERVDAVMETVGEATWDHSLKSLKPGGRLVISGATSGQNPPASLNRIFFLQLSVLGSTMGTLAEFQDLVTFVAKKNVKPIIHNTWNLADAREAFEVMERGDVRGKLVLNVS